jgi:Flp pilus assembly pilin Flp
MRLPATSFQPLERRSLVMFNDSPKTHPQDRFVGVTPRSDEGQTTVEYALITTLVIGLAIVSFAALQSSLLSFFTNLAGQLASIASGG